MCGRTAQTYSSVVVAARALGVPDDHIPKSPQESSTTSTSTSPAPGTHPPASSNAVSAGNDDDTAPSSIGQEGSFQWRDNYNLSPGMNAYVIYRTSSDSSRTDNHEGAWKQHLRVDLKTWGLVTRGGTPASPLQASMSTHFSNRMFNARTDTLWEKPTFSALARAGQTCVIALEGFFEWKAESSKVAAAASGSKKQPYFVYRKPYLLLAGLWTRVSTGHGYQVQEDRPPYLDTFTILTTEVSPSLSWLHTRMPIALDEELAQRWLRAGPTMPVLLQQMEQRAHELELEWYAVTPLMSSLKFRSPDAITPLPKPKTLTSFFQAKGNSTPSQEKQKTKRSTIPSPSRKRPLDTSHISSPIKSVSTAVSTTPRKKATKGTIDSFFAKKTKDAT